MQKFETRELKNLIARSFGSIAEFCKAAGIENPQRYEQALEKSELTAKEIEQTAAALRIPPQEIDFYFFKPLEDPTPGAKPCKV